MTMALYRLEGLRLARGTEFELTVDEMTVSSGETLCLAGPTGSGKTTLLRVLSGLQPIESGRVQFDGRIWCHGMASLAEIRTIALVPQRPILLSRSVRANLEYGLLLRRAASDERVDAMLTCLGLTKLAKQAANTLSGGQMQLVALGRALILAPRVLLLDEPTANLDPQCVALVEQVLNEYRRSRNTTLIWATHNLFQTRRVADRVALLLGGQIVEVASCEEFFDRPRDYRTADFVNGRMVY